MANPIDIARYFVQLAHEASVDDDVEPMTHLRVQKLLYYAQGWSLAAQGNPLFPDPVEAWKHGPVVESVWHEFKGYGKDPIEHHDETPIRLDDNEKAFVRSIWEGYKQFSASELRRKTHSERPWLLARRDCGAGDPSDAEITHESMLEYFSGLLRRRLPPEFEPERIRDAERDFKKGKGVSLREAYPRAERRVRP